MRKKTKSRKNRPPTAGAGKHDRRILDAIRRIIRAVDIDSRRLAGSHDITAPQLLTLMAAVEKSPLTAHEVANRIHISATTLVGVLARLEEKSLIVRRRNAADRREVEIIPTAAGRRLVAATPFPLQNALQGALGQLPMSEREQLARWIERLVDLMDARGLDARPMLEFRSLR